MSNGTTLRDEIETGEQHETFRRMLLHWLDDPQIQQKIIAFLRHSGLIRSTGISVPPSLNNRSTLLKRGFVIEPVVARPKVEVSNGHSYAQSLCF